MKLRFKISPAIITWAMQRYGENHITPKDRERFSAWQQGKMPTLKQIRDFSKKFSVPFGYWFLDKPPAEQVLIPFFRRSQPGDAPLSLNMRDLIETSLQRQTWLREYMESQNHSPLPFVGRHANSSDVQSIVADIRRVLELEENWAQHTSDPYNFLMEKIEANGIFVSKSSIVGNNTHRKIEIDECRGFTLVDEHAPFIFVNGNDYANAQTFTLAHELAHVWVGFSSGFETPDLLPPDNTIERTCDEVAAELLLPEKSVSELWHQNKNTDLEKVLDTIARTYHVSKFVSLRRALDIQDVKQITQATYHSFYEDFKRNIPEKSSSNQGGNFYSTIPYRIGKSFLKHIAQAINNRSLLHRDAYHLTGLPGKTYHALMQKSGLE